MARRAHTDAVMKYIIKQPRNALSDKCLIGQRAATEVYRPDQETRSLSKLIGHMLASTQTLRTLPVVDPAKSKKNNKQEKNSDDDADKTIDQPSALSAAEASKSILIPS